MFRAIRADLIKSDGEALAYTINTQGLPVYLVTMYGDDALETRLTTVQWDTSTPADLATEAQTLISVAGAVNALRETLGDSVDEDALATRFGVPRRARVATDVPSVTTSTPAEAGYESQASAVRALVARLPEHVRRMPLDTLASLYSRAA
jgi:phage gp29-like protein